MVCVRSLLWDESPPFVFLRHSPASRCSSSVVFGVWTSATFDAVIFVAPGWSETLSCLTYGGLACLKTDGEIVFFSLSDINSPVPSSTAILLFLSSSVRSPWLKPNSWSLSFYCKCQVALEWLYSRKLLSYLCFYFKQIIISCTSSSVCRVSAPLDFLHILCYLLLWCFLLSKVTCKQWYWTI